MPINFIINDPGVQGATAQPVQSSPDRPAAQVGFSVSALPAEQVYATTTTKFVAWQAREAALRTLKTFQDIAGPLVGWTGKASKKKLALRPNDGQDLNAYYDRNSVSFFEFQLGQRTLFSGASTDVVAHEVGHAILDALRPDLWNAQMVEVPALHEGFGDCIAIMVALSDKATRVAILKNDSKLAKGNFVEATAEELSYGIAKAVSPNHNAAKPRRALSTFQWALPETLPMNGKPGVLINEIHSFGQLTSGCYYQLIREIFLGGPGGEANLWKACQTATRLLARAVAEAPIRARFLETVGRTMILVDRNQNNAANETFIRNAFQRHGIALSVTAFLTPRVSLGAPSTGTRRTRKAGKRGRGKASMTTLSATTRRSLHSVLEVHPSTKLETSSFTPAAREAAQVVAYRAVDLTGVSERLSNVKVYTPYSALVGSDGQGAAVLGAVDSGAIISREVRNYVETLVNRGQIDFGNKAKTKAGKKKAGRKSIVMANKKRMKKKGSGFVSLNKQPTHMLMRVGGEAVIERVSFACGCAPTRWLCRS